MRNRSSIAVIVGTRPEAIKMAPVVQALARSGTLRPFLISTGQQRELTRQALASVNLAPEVDLDLMRPNQSLASLTARVVDAVYEVLARSGCTAALVHGDTTTALSGALAVSYARLPLGHVEAGLRTYDFDHPWPEEINRRLIDPLCRWCFAPTELSAANLRSERIPAERIHVTGNTVIDALMECSSRIAAAPAPAAGLRTVLVTGHRRESFGDGFLAICRAIRRLVDARENVRVVYPVHLNPNVREPVYRLLSDHPRIHLQEPVAYEEFVRLMRESYFILTDSGGVQEEAPSLGKPVLVMRETTERPEGVTAGTCRLVGTDADRIVAECLGLLDDPEEYRRRSALRNPYGDGMAAARIVKVLEGDLDSEKKAS
jgi:UDP-N-acetylglucosamine 2-epimerase (non-hydrolysing)